MYTKSPCEQKGKKVIVPGVILGSWRAKLKQWIHFRLINWKKNSNIAGWGCSLTQDFCTVPLCKLPATNPLSSICQPKSKWEKKCKWTGIRVISFAVCIGTCILKTGTQMHNKKTFIHHSYTPAPPYKHRNAHEHKYSESLSEEILHHSS